MAWERGFVVCKDEFADTIQSVLAEQSNCTRLISQGGETAFAFAGRAIPTIDTESCFFCAVDGRNSGYSHSSPIPYRPSRLIPKLGLTFGIALRTDDIGLRTNSPVLAANWRALGPESDCASEGGITAFRWDLDDCEVDDSRIHSQTQNMRAIQRWLVEQTIPYAIALFDKGWAEIVDELPQIDELSIGPSTCLTLRWQSRTGEPNSVTANDAEFIVDGDEAPDCELWLL